MLVITEIRSLLQNHTEAWDCLKCLQQVIFLYVAGF